MYENDQNGVLPVLIFLWYEHNFDNISYLYKAAMHGGNRSVCLILMKLSLLSPRLLHVSCV